MIRDFILARALELIFEDFGVSKDALVAEMETFIANADGDLAIGGAAWMEQWLPKFEEHFRDEDTAKSALQGLWEDATAVRPRFHRHHWGCGVAGSGPGVRT